jgi:hypothetical protein
MNNVSSLTDAHVPIVGQQLTTDGYTIVVSARCQCESPSTFVPISLTCSSAITLSQPGTCPKCGMGYAIQDMKLDAHGRLIFAIAVQSVAAVSES